MRDWIPGSRSAAEAAPATGSSHPRPELSIPRSHRCRVCGVSATLVASDLISNGYTLCRCSACDTVLVDQSPSAEDFRRVYDEMFACGEYRAMRAETRLMQQRRVPRNFHRARVLKQIERICGGRRLLEIGGGSGSFGMLVRSRGWQYTNWDISPVAVEMALSVGLEARVFEPGSVPPLPPDSADAVVMWEVIEHVWDVHAYLRTIRSALRSDGVFVASTPNYLREGYARALSQVARDMSPPVHVNFFTAESLARTLRAAGFQHVHVSSQRLQLPGRSVQSVIGNIKVALGLSPPKTLYALTRPA